jgi:predicted nucleotidyltransferase
VRSLASAHLTGDQRRLLERFVYELGELMGDELAAVWLFGSRARGETAGEDSDIDLLVLAADASWDGKERIHAVLGRVAAELDLSAITWDLSIHVHTPEWLRGRREIRSFFIAEVDRDKVVLHGDL